MTDRFTDNLHPAAIDSEPHHAWDLLRRLGAEASDHSVQVSAVQTWLNEGHAVSPLLRISLESRHLPLSATRRAA